VFLGVFQRVPYLTEKWDFTQKRPLFESAENEKCDLGSENRLDDKN
jgi:hypothetical protein